MLETLRTAIESGDVCLLGVILQEVLTTIDAQIAAAAINHGCTLLTLDRDLPGVARHFPLRFA